MVERIFQEIDGARSLELRSLQEVGILLRFDLLRVPKSHRVVGGAVGANVAKRTLLKLCPHNRAAASP